MIPPELLEQMPPEWRDQYLAYSMYATELAPLHEVKQGFPCGVCSYGYMIWQKELDDIDVVGVVTFLCNNPQCSRVDYDLDITRRSDAIPSEPAVQVRPEVQPSEQPA